MTWRTADKTAWGDGPWQDEPDKEQWADEATGLPCLIVRGPGGALCGYAGVPEGHPWFGEDYEAVIPHPEVHGGLSYSGACREGPEDGTICHAPAPGEPDRVWWLGFDCSHYTDLQPGADAELAELGITRSPGPFGRTYKALGYVKAECARLAAQITAGMPGPGEEFECAVCHGTFTRGRSDIEALAEMHAMWQPDEGSDDPGIVCDDCFQAIVAWAHVSAPEAFR